jgi:hypothetical protein
MLTYFWNKKNTERVSMVLLVSNNTDFLQKAMSFARDSDFRVATGEMTVTQHLRMFRREINRVIMDAPKLNNNVKTMLMKVHVYGELGTKIFVVTNDTQEEKTRLASELPDTAIIFVESLQHILVM